MNFYDNALQYYTEHTHTHTHIYYSNIDNNIIITIYLILLLCALQCPT